MPAPVDNELLKFLVFGPAAKDIDQSTTAIKWASTTPVSKFGTQFFTLNIPNEGFIAPQSLGCSYIVRQYNFSLPQYFTITNWQQIRNFVSGAPIVVNQLYAIRFWNKTTGQVVRYLFANAQNLYQDFYFSLYTGQILPPNITIEIWYLFSNATGSVALTGLTLNTSMLQIPSSAGPNPANPFYSPINDVPLSDLQWNTPFNIPLGVPIDGPFVGN